ncbi:hypothetical protein Pcinc_038258 [Petrolisthes cinctipes]|uniref:Uncharacterized protein n=1 Tax=Petrolisthes cinctipes TaxID=88211 RepID=A0AAE1BU43_PETCI|nr:hypothetical protein Pcinc_038258 [Petrolisthes cinctipes]
MGDARKERPRGAAGIKRGVGWLVGWWKISGSILSASRSGLEVVAPSVSEGLTGAASKRRGRLQDAAQGSDSPVSASKIWNPGALEEGGGGAPARKQ